MAFKFTRALALTTALSAAGLAGAAAIAQTSPSQAPGAGPSAPAQAGPETGQRGSMGQGYGYGRGYGEQSGRGGWRAMSAQDREAMMAARMAAVKAGLVLTPEQEKLWPPVENAVREGMKQREEWRARMDKEGVAANPVERMRRMGEMSSARGAMMTRFADAAAPLYASLTDDQKRRLQMLGGSGMGGMMGRMGMMGGAGPYGEGRRGEGRRGEGMGHHGTGHHGMGGQGMGRGGHHSDGRHQYGHGGREGGRL